MPSSAGAILELPHAIDENLLTEDLRQVIEFLRSVETARERELNHCHGEFFHILANQWMDLASLHYLFQHAKLEIVHAAKHGVNEFILGLELGGEVEPFQALEFFASAVAIDEMACAHFITSAPEESLGFHYDPASPQPILVNAAFALLANEDSLLEPGLDTLDGLLIRHPEDIEPPPNKTVLDNLYYILSAIKNRDAAAFNSRIDERCQIRAAQWGPDAVDDPPRVIDWLALGLVRFARERGLGVTTEHVYVPLQIIEASGRMKA